MTSRLDDLRRQLGVSRRRLEELARRLGELRARMGVGADVTPPPVAAAPAVEARAPLFTAMPGSGTGPLDDVELTFEVLDTEDPGRR
jgi:hypothetical protein